MPHIEVAMIDGEGSGGESETWRRKEGTTHCQLLPPIILTPDGHLSFQNTKSKKKDVEGRRRTSGGGGGETIRIQVTLHKPLHWQLSTKDKDNKLSSRKSRRRIKKISPEKREELEKVEKVEENHDEGYDEYPGAEVLVPVVNRSISFPSTNSKENFTFTRVIHQGKRNRGPYVGCGKNKGSTTTTPPQLHPSPRPHPTTTEEGYSDDMTWFKGHCQTSSSSAASSSSSSSTKPKRSLVKNSRNLTNLNLNTCLFPKCAMGAGGSSQNLSKSKSQSSSALQSNNNNNQQQGRTPTTNMMMVSSSNNNGNVNSNSMWELPTTNGNSGGNNGSPSHRKILKHHNNHHHQSGSPSSSGSRSRIMKIGRGNKSSSSSSTDRAKLYAVSSCPDVVQQAQQEQMFILPPPEGFGPGPNPALNNGPYPRKKHEATCPLSQVQYYQYHQSVPTAYQVPPGPMLMMTMMPQGGVVQPHPQQLVFPPSSQPRVGVQPLRAQHNIIPNNNFQSPRKTRRKSMSAAEMDTMFPSFVVPENIFEVHLIRDQRGLGLSVTGGRDTSEKFAGLIRIKKVFPMSPASESGRIEAWDVILQANGTPLTGLTNQEALSILRTTPTETILVLCRPPKGTPGFSDDSSNPSNLPSYFPSSSKSKSLSNLQMLQPSSSSFGEFEVTLEKVQGSLGFTLRQEDSSVLGHYVRALVKEPALTDGRIQPGDRILSVNRTDLSGLNHAEAIAFLRGAGEVVTLRLWRDSSPYPDRASTEEGSIISNMRTKPKPLRQEALDMLQDLALRKQQNSSLPGSLHHSRHRDHHHHGRGLGGGGKTTGESSTSSGSQQDPATLPRRMRRGQHPHPSPEVLEAALSRFAVSMKKEVPVATDTQKNQEVEDDNDDDKRSSGSGESSTPVLQKRERDLRSDSIISTNSSVVGGAPSFLLHLDKISPGDEDEEETRENDHFRHGQPKYQSAIIFPKSGSSGTGNLSRNKSFGAGTGTGVGTSSSSTMDSPLLLPPRTAPKGKSVSASSSSSSSTCTSTSSTQKSTSTLLKWKGILLEENGEVRCSPDGREVVDLHLNEEDDDDDDEEEGDGRDENGDQIMTIQLSRRWCSRLGFSLRGSQGRTFVSAIYPDSVAAKDGRLKVGDEVLMVNDEPIQDLETTEVIDLMRKTRGVIMITLRRKKGGGGGGDQVGHSHSHSHSSLRELKELEGIEEEGDNNSNSSHSSELGLR